MPLDPEPEHIEPLCWAIIAIVVILLLALIA